MSAKQSKSSKDNTKTGKNTAKTSRAQERSEVSRAEPSYDAKLKQSLAGASFSGTPTHPAYRDKSFLRSMQREHLEKRRREGSGYLDTILAAVGTQGASRRRIELEQEVASAAAAYNALAQRMQEQIGAEVEQLLLPFAVPRTHLDAHDDLGAIMGFLSAYWEFTRDRRPVSVNALRGKVLQAYANGCVAGEQRFAREYSGPGYGDEFRKQADQLLRQAQKAYRAGKLR